MSECAVDCDSARITGILGCEVCVSPAQMIGWFPGIRANVCEKSHTRSEHWMRWAGHIDRPNLQRLKVLPGRRNLQSARDRLQLQRRRLHHRRIQYLARSIAGATQTLTRTEAASELTCRFTDALPFESVELDAALNVPVPPVI